jgi:hypothetical protein
LGLLERIRSALGGWPEEMPRLYPGLSADDFYCFFSEPEARSARVFHRTMVLPLVPAGDRDERSYAVGYATQQYLIRNLQMLPTWSVAGPDDTPDLPRERHEHYAATALPVRRHSVIGGRAWLEGSQTFRFAGEIYQRHGAGRLTCSTQADSFRGLLRDVGRRVCELLEQPVPPVLETPWAAAVPERVEELLSYGDIVSRTLRGQDMSGPALALLDRAPRISLAARCVHPDHPRALEALLEAYRVDDHSAQICFELFCLIWKRDTHEVTAQWPRRAIEIAPEHGKAHMVMPHAMPRRYEEDRLRHSELGYLLLPGNTFAVSNYANNLVRAGRDPSVLVRLYHEGLAHDPENARNYGPLIDYYASTRQYARALELAERLAALYGPGMSDRTRYCLEQSPVTKELLRSGRYDPLAELRSWLEDLRRQASQT